MAEQDCPETRVNRWVIEHGVAVRGYIEALVRRADLAEDLVQEVYRRAWQARDRYEDQGSPRAYLLRIADRLVCDHCRRANREVSLDDAAWSEVEPLNRDVPPSQSLAIEEAAAALNAAMNALTEPQRRVLLLRYYGELSFVEIAGTMECSLSTALSHCRRGLAALRKTMTENPT